MALFGFPSPVESSVCNRPWRTNALEAICGVNDARVAKVAHLPEVAIAIPALGRASRSGRSDVSLEERGSMALPGISSIIVLRGRKPRESILRRAQDGLPSFSGGLSRESSSSVFVRTRFSNPDQDTGRTVAEA